MKSIKQYSKIYKYLSKIYNKNTFMLYKTEKIQKFSERRK